MGDVGMVTGPHAALAQYVRVYKKIPVDLLANQTNRFPADVREDLTHLVPAVEIYTQD